MLDPMEEAARRGKTALLSTLVQSPCDVAIAGGGAIGVHLAAEPSRCDVSDRPLERGPEGLEHEKFYRFTTGGL
jgi:hypothetical protein